jgi:hypothetical protein
MATSVDSRAAAIPAGVDAEQLRAEIRQDLEAIDACEENYGSFAEMVRQHYRTMRRGTR